MTAMTITILVGIEMIIMLFLLMVMVGQVFAGFEPNMPRVATASGGGGGQQDVQQKSIVRSASAVSLTAGRAKVRQDAQENATNTFHLIKISCDIEATEILTMIVPKQEQTVTTREKTLQLTKLCRDVATGEALTCNIFKEDGLRDTDPVGAIEEIQGPAIGGVVRFKRTQRDNKIQIRSWRRGE